jgi:hypothetical protein
VNVSGRVNGTGQGVRANVQFSSLTLDGASALTTMFKQSVVTDDGGNYMANLFPGQYRVVVLPSGGSIAPPAAQNGVPGPMGSAAEPWAIKEETWTISAQASQTIDVGLVSKQTIAGIAYTGSADLLAVGALFDATPAVVPRLVGALNSVLAQTPVAPRNASIGVNYDGRFALPLDPGDYDLSLRAPESSNFAWWIRSEVHIGAPGSTDAIPAQVARLPYPVPLEGVITVPDAAGPRVLRGAAVRAYAKGPTGNGVAKVGDTRTDETGHYRLRLPPSFAP